MRRFLYAAIAMLAVGFAACNNSEEPTPAPMLKFDVTANNLTSTSATLNVKPSLDDATYYFNLFPAEQVGDKAAEFVATLNIESIYMGEQSITFEELTPSTAYTFIVFGYSSEQQRITTDVTRLDITTTEAEEPGPAPELKEMHTIELSEITWRDALLTITPEDEAQEYVCGIYTRAVYDERFGSDKDAIISARIAEWKATAEQYKDYGYDDPWQFYMQGEQHCGTCDILASELRNLSWDEEYVIYCFGITDEGNVTSAVTIASLETLAPSSSNNSFEIIVDATTESLITFTVKTSNDEPYFVSLQQTAYTDFFGPDAEQSYTDMIRDLVGTYPDNTLYEKFIHNGTQQFTSDEFLSSINPMREYKVIVCGFENGPTTEVVLSEAIKPESAPADEPLELSINITDITTTTLTVDVTASDDSHTYHLGLYDAAMAEDLDALLSSITTTESFIEQLYTGSRSITFETLTPNTPYTVVAFAIDADTMTVGEVTTLDATTNEEPTDGGAFRLELSDITWHDATLSVTPTDGGMKYIAGIMPKSDYTNKCGATPEGIIQRRLDEWQDIADMYKEWGYNDPWQHYMRAELKSGTRSLVGSQLCVMRWASDYVAYCFGMETTGEVTSEAIVVEFRTLAPEASANSFSVTLDGSADASVSFTVTPSNDDPYYLSVQQKSYVECYGPSQSESYEDMIFNLTGEYSDAMLENSIYSGTESITIENLRTDRQYCIVVCGFENGPTTEVYISEAFYPME